MISRYKKWLEQEIDSNEKLLKMVQSVPESNRSDSRFQLAVDLGRHMCACRDNWLVRITGSGDEGDWWPKGESIETLSLRMKSYESDWTRYLSILSNEELAEDFQFGVSGGNRYNWNVEGQIMQMVGHAFYHRGQIALLVDQLGGTVIDTDYLYWAYQQDPRWGIVAP
jgi:uncharacterized damage-inducible protein DinB